MKVAARLGRPPFYFVFPALRDQVAPTKSPDRAVAGAPPGNDLAKTRKKAKSGEQRKGREKNMAETIAVGGKND